MFQRENRDRMFLYVFILSLASVGCSFAYTSFEVTRATNGDTFDNPTAAMPCGWDEKSKKFCTEKNARCQPNCCRCLCGNPSSTVDKGTMACHSNREFRKGCTLLFLDVYQGNPLKLLDLTSDGDAQISWDGTANSDEFKSCWIDQITQFNSRVPFAKNISVDDIENNGYRRLIKIKWDDEHIDSSFYGKVFKVGISCTIKEKGGGPPRTTNKTRCFVFKSVGKMKIFNPVLTSPVVTSIRPRPPTTKRPPTRKPTGRKPETSPSTSETSVPPTTVTDDTDQIGSGEIITTDEQSTTGSGAPLGTEIDAGKGKHGGGGGKGSNTGVIAAVVVVIGVLLLVAVFIFVLWRRKKSAAATKTEETSPQGALNDGARISNNAIAMNSLENIYAEADVKAPQNSGQDNGVYTYADNRYSCLMKTDVPEESNFYQPLNTTTGKNVYECIPVQKDTSPKTGDRNQPPISEPIYHVVDGDSNAPDNIYHVLDEKNDQTSNASLRQPGACSTQPAEQVYSVLEENHYNTAGESVADYLTVLPESTGYECPASNA